MTRSALVVGAGLAGLACAWRLRRAGVDVRVLEAAPRAGGVIGTLAEGGYRFETGPNTVPATAPGFSALVRDLGLADEVVLSDDAAKVRQLYFRGSAVALPSGPGALLTSPLLSLRGKLRMLAEPLRKRAPHDPRAPEPTLAEFFAERIGREPTQRLLGAFVRGVYGGEVDRLGARSAFPTLWQLVQEHGSLARGLLGRARARRKAASEPTPEPADPPIELPIEPLGPRGSLASFPGGMQTLIDALGAQLGDALTLDDGAAELERSDAGWTVTCASGERHGADDVVLALPAPAAARLLGENAEVARTLAAVEYAAMTVVHLGYPEEAGVPSAFGCLVPPEAAGDPAAPRFLGALYPNRIFPGRAPAGGQTVACFYRSSAPALAAGDPVHVAREDLGRLGIGRGAEPRASRVLQWAHAIPQYTPGHDERLAAVENELSRTHPRLHLAASYVGGVSVEAASSRGRQIADRIAGRPAKS